MTLSVEIGLPTYVEVIQVIPRIDHFHPSNVVLGASRWQNPGNRFDVLNDGVVDSKDYDAVLDYMARHGSGTLPKKKPVSEPYVDVDGDGQISNRDALQLAAFLQEHRAKDITPADDFHIVDFRIERDLLDPSMVSTVKDAAAHKNIFPLSSYVVYARNLSTNELISTTFSTAVYTRDSLVFIHKDVLLPPHELAPGCYPESCVLRLIKARLTQILPARFNAKGGPGLPMPGTDTTELPLVLPPLPTPSPSAPILPPVPTPSEPIPEPPPLPPTTVAWVAVGGGPNSIATSEDGIIWTGRTGKSIFGGVGHGVAWNGHMWVAVGEPGLEAAGANSIAYSYNGVDWTGCGLVFTWAGRAVAWNGSMWIAVGQNNFPYTKFVATSPDGINWTLQSSTVLGVGNGIAWNGSIWVAAGKFGSGNNACIATSTDGVTWTSRLSGNWNTVGHMFGVAWNGGMFVAVGNPVDLNAIAFSYDGITWSMCGGRDIYPWGGRGIAYGDGKWVAVGGGYIAISTDGINWASQALNEPGGAGNIYGYGVAWNGAIWVTMQEGQPPSFSSMRYSYDGLTWYNGTNVFAGGDTRDTFMGGVACSGRILP